ncbi:MAG: hypothetical protein ACOYOK_00925 [Pseudobdellovibrionaceae bacterium]
MFKFLILILFHLYLPLAMAKTPVTQEHTTVAEPKTDPVVAESLASAGGNIITRREAEISYWVEKILFSADKKMDIGALTSDLLLEQVVFFEAENFNVGQVSAEELKKNQDKVEQQFQLLPAAKVLQPTKDELKKIVRRKVLAKNFLELKTKSLSTIVSDDEARTYFDKNRAKFGEIPFENLKENIKTFLSKKQLEDRLTHWFEVIKRKYKARFLQS